MLDGGEFAYVIVCGTFYVQPVRSGLSLEAQNRLLGGTCGGLAGR